jgi:hypothetical protein
VAQTGQRSRHDGKSRQRPFGQIDVEWIVGQRFEGFDRFELVRQKRALAKMKVSYRWARAGSGRLAVENLKVAQPSDTGITRNPFVRSLPVGGVSIIARSRFLVARFHFGPSRCSVGSKIGACLYV